MSKKSSQAFVEPQRSVLEVMSNEFQPTLENETIDGKDNASKTNSAAEINNAHAIISISSQIGDPS